MTDRYASLKQGLVGCWIPSISGSGLLLPDLSGRGNNGSLVGMDASDWVSSQYGRALDFDGVDDYVGFSRNAPILSTNFTISLWFKPNALDQATRYLLSASENNDNHYSIIQGYVANTIEFYAGASGNGAAFRSNSQISISETKWYHIAYSFRPSSLTAWRDGVLQNTNTSATTLNSAASPSLFLMRFSLFGNSYNAQIDDIRIYSRTLTDSEIKLLSSEPGIGFKPAKKLSRFSQRFTYNPPKAKVFEGVRVRDHDYSSLRQGLVGAWCPSLPNGGSGNLLVDQSQRGNHGTLTNMSASAWVSGQYGRALDFDGSNDWVNAGNSSSLSFAPNNAFTLSSWIQLRNLPVNSLYGIIARGQYNNNLEYNFYIGEDNNRVRFTLGDGVTKPVYFGRSTGPISSTAWAHYCAKYDGSSTLSGMSIWLNGQRIDNADYSGGGTYVSMANQSANVSIGALNFGNAFYMNGWMDDIRIYNRAITEPEIRLLASRPGIGLQPSPTRFVAREKKTGLRRKILTGLP